jgi:hypothetical protein
MRTFFRRAGLITAMAVLGAFAVGGTAGAAGLARGATTVTLNQATIGVVVNDLGLTPAALQPGSLGMSGSDLQAAFPIVGNLKDGIIKHTGGLSLTDGETTLYLTKYFIDTNSGVLTAKASVDGSPVGRIPLFDLGAAPAQPGCAATAQLGLSADAAAALVAVFGLPVTPGDLTGADFGVACVAPR